MTVGTSLAAQQTLVSRALGPRTIAAAESCTAGLLMAALADIVDASEHFKGGVVPYVPEDKASVLGVDRAIIEDHGVVSADCAQAMAKRVRDMFGSDVGVAITGVAGPTQQEEKPVGLVFVAVAVDGSTAVREHRFKGGRAANRIAAVEAALDLLIAEVRSD